MDAEAPTKPMIDRLSIRSRPPGHPIMHQVWDKLLFLHWQVSAAALRPRIPDRLTIDTFEDGAWVGIIPFTMHGIRPVYLPALPLASRSREINVRTYVHLEGVPGVWFFSLDADNPLAVLGARAGFALPYYQARMMLQEQGGTIRFTSRRVLAGPRATFEAEWEGGERLPDALPGTLEFFLIERYCLYAIRGRRLYRARIYHSPWPLRQARLLSLSSSMLQAQGLHAPEEEPLVHQQADPLHVEIWSPERV